MKRRTFVPLIFSPLAYASPDPSRIVVRGRLAQAAGEPPKILATGGKPVLVTGDEATRGVLNDPRLKDADFEVTGHYTAPGTLEIDPIHTRSMFAYKDGRRLMVTYWCDICYIRTYTPGVCWCCQKWTDLDLREPDAPDPKP